MMAQARSLASTPPSGVLGTAGTAYQAPPTVFVSAFRNFSMRYIVYSGILDELRRNGNRIVVFVQDEDVAYYRKKLGDRGLLVEGVKAEAATDFLTRTEPRRVLWLARALITGRRPGFENTTHELFDHLYERQMAGSRRIRYRYRIARTIAGVGRHSRLARRALLGLETIAYGGTLYDEYFERYAPQMLIVSSVGYRIDPLFMRAARRHGCKVVSIVHSWDNPSTKGFRGSTPDRVVAWTPQMRDELMAFQDVPPERIFVGGVAHWDLYFDGTAQFGPREDFLRRNQLSADRKTLFYAASSPRNFPRTFDVLRGLLSAAQEGRFGAPVQLLVRLHPSYLLKTPEKGTAVVEAYQRRMDELVREFPGRVKFALPQMPQLHRDIDMPMEDMRVLAETLYHCDVLLNEYSTVLIEGAIYDKPIVNVGLHNYRDTTKPASYFETLWHLRRVLSTGACRNAHSMEELISHINSYLGDPSLEREERRKLVDQEIPINRGHAATTIGQEIVRWLDPRAPSDKVTVETPAGALRSRRVPVEVGR